jgi:Caspase domain
MKFTTVVLILAFSAHCIGQSFSGKTNNVHVDLRIPLPESEMPVISWITPSLEYTNSQSSSIEIESLVKSSSAIKAIKLVIIDPDKEEREKTYPVETNVFEKSIKQNLQLQDGQYTLKIIVTNSTGGKVSSSRNVIIGKDAIADAIALDRKDYALLIATDKYDNWTDLVNPVNDATAISKELKDRYGFEVELVENPTQDEMLVKIREYSERKYKPQDQLFIFFAGHGQFDEAFGEGYVVARNSLENDKAKSSYISHSNLRSYIGNIPCQHILLTMDVCFGGTFDPVIARSRGADSYSEVSQSEFLVRKLSSKTRKYITSGGKEYVSDGVVGKHSPFAAKFIESLRSNGGNDRILVMSEILSFLEKISTNEPRSGDFGDGEKSADFVFVAKQ